MEIILALYHEPYDETRPVICFDESSKALRSHVRDPLPARSGAVARVDTHYERNGKQYVHLATGPLAGWQQIEITGRRRKREWVPFMCQLADEHYPDAARIRVVLDKPQRSQSGCILRVSPARASAWLS